MNNYVHKYLPEQITTFQTISLQYLSDNLFEFSIVCNKYLQTMIIRIVTADGSNFLSTLLLGSQVSINAQILIDYKLHNT